MTLRSTLRKPHVCAFICCSLIGVLGLVFVFVGIGGGFVKPTAYSLQCNATAKSPARLNCVAQWDKYAVDSRVYTNLCLCERTEVIVAGPGPEVSGASSDSSSSTVDIPKAGSRLPWETKRTYKRTDDCAVDYPANGTFGCYWYPLGDQIDNVTVYSYADKTDFRGANAVFAVGILVAFIAVLADCFIVFTKMCQNPCKSS